MYIIGFLVPAFGRPPSFGLLFLIILNYIIMMLCIQLLYYGASIWFLNTVSFTESSLSISLSQLSLN